MVKSKEKKNQLSVICNLLISFFFSSAALEHNILTFLFIQDTKHTFVKQLLNALLCIPSITVVVGKSNGRLN